MLNLFIPFGSSRFFVNDKLDKNEITVQNFAEQLIDHDKPDRGVYTQRYYDQDSPTYQKGNPIILYLSGESDTFAPRYRNFLKDLADDFGAKVLSLEHRYYGESYPTEYTATEHADLTLLTVDQALKDAVYFKDWYTKTNQLNETTKWIVVGGSYPGLLSAFIMKPEYNGNFSGSISSSGVVYATDSYDDFDLSDAITMGPVCSHAAREARVQLYNLLENDEDGSKFNYIRKFMGLGNTISRQDFDFVVGEMFTIALQYGNVSAFCAPLEKAVHLGQDLVSALAEFSRTFFVANACDSDDAEACDSTYSSAYMKNPIAGSHKNAARHWLWQCCTEVGYWQVASSRLSLRAPTVTKEYFQEQCNDVFAQEGIQPLDVNAFNTKYGGYAQTMEHVIYTTSSHDPWTWVCMDQEKLDAQNVTNSYAFNIKGAGTGHCSDLGKRTLHSSPDLIRTQEKMKKILAQWISE